MTNTPSSDPSAVQAAALLAQSPALVAYGFGPAQAEALANYQADHPGAQAARVVRVERNGYRLAPAEQPGGWVEAVWPAGRRHKLMDVPVIGDWVAYSSPEVAEGTEQALRIEAVIGRRNAFVRSVQKGHRVQPQVLAANVDTVFIMTSPEEWEPERLERYVQAVQLSDAQPVILLNKVDLADPEFLAAAEASDFGVPLLPIAAESGAGLEALTPYLSAGQTVALIGSSGMGKSTLTNRLLGEQKTLTAGLSEALGEGRHTTTWRTLYPLPSTELGGGALLIDNPGLRDIAVWDEEGAAFWAIEELAADCRFSRCTHGREPGCAVQAAVKRGEIDADVLDAFRERYGLNGEGGGKKEKGGKGQGGGKKGRTGRSRR